MFDRKKKKKLLEMGFRTSEATIIIALVIIIYG